MENIDRGAYTVKKDLFNLCVAYVRSRLSGAQEAIAGAQSSANEETKSSAGDKYETGRAMAQLEIEKNTQQLNESQKLMNVLEQIKEISSSSVIIGSLVFTTEGNFYISISAGKFVTDGIDYFAISPASPVGKQLMGMREGEKFSFNQRNFVVEKIA